MGHAESVNDPQFEELQDYIRTAGLQLFHSYVGPWHEELNQRFIHYAMRQHPNDWYVVTDLDELQVYEQPLPDLIELCERDGFDHVNGCVLDRVANGGVFSPLASGSIWKQYPLAGSITAAVLRALPLKTGLVRGNLDLLTGLHGVRGGNPLPSERGTFQSHHFKWTGSVLSRLRKRIELCESGEWPIAHPYIALEAKRFLSYVDHNNGRIDITDKRLHFHEAGSEYHSYPYWAAIQEESQGWAWALTY
jgi:hypothetical protein